MPVREYRQHEYECNVCGCTKTTTDKFANYNNCSGMYQQVVPEDWITEPQVMCPACKASYDTWKEQLRREHANI